MRSKLDSDPCARSIQPTRSHLRRAGLLALASIPFAVACADIPDPGIEYDPEWEMTDFDDASVDETEELEDKAAINVSVDLAKKIAEAAPKSASGLPLWESRPGAKVALYLDFDGGRYDGQDYRGIDRDGNRSRFGTEEQVAIIRAALEVVEGYKGFNVNVTTSEAAMRKAPKWGWILITDDEGTSGEAYVGSIARSSQCSTSSCSPRGFAGSDAVFSPPSAQRGYLLIHELGHQFGLNHSGLYENGQFREWSELKQSRTGDWLGGRSSYFNDYKWIRSQTKYSTSWQDPEKIIGSIAGTVGGGSCHGSVPLNDSSYCTDACPCNVGEGDCDSDSQCVSGLVCEERGAVDVCVKASGGSCHGSVPRNDSSYCTDACPCNADEGDCDTDSQCASGLVCEERGAVDVCVKASGGSCHGSVPRNDSSYCTSSCPCNAGEGDCDNDSQCASGLVCEERGAVDVCVQASGGSCHTGRVFESTYCSTSCRCDAGEGDCDRDADCKSGLRCVQRDGPDICMKR